MKITSITKVLFAACCVFLWTQTAPAEEAEIQKEYWPDGKVRVVKTIDQEGDPVEISYYREDGTLEQQEKFDTEGRKIEECYYNEKGRLRENADGWAAMKFVYKGGQERQENYYGADGKLKERKQYDAGGNLVAKQYVGDSDDMPAEEYNPEPPILGHEEIDYYDSSGRPEGVTAMDREGDPWGSTWDDDWELRDSRGED